MPVTFPILGGKLKLLDVLPRPSEDALWLATTMPALPRGSAVLDVGCGSGTAGLVLLKRQPHLKLSSLDIDPALTTLATQNAAINHLKTTVYTEDILSNPRIGLFDAILCNPPFHKQDRGHKTASTAKTLAHTLPANQFPFWLAALTRLLTPQGTLHLIVHSACEADLRTFAPLHGYSLHLTPLQTHPERPAKRLLADLQPALLPQIITTPPLPAYNPTVRQHHLYE